MSPVTPFSTVSIVGATVSPYLLNFYFVGAIEEKWTEQDLWINRLTAWLRHGIRQYGHHGMPGHGGDRARSAAPEGRDLRAGRANVRAGLRSLGRHAVRHFARHWLLWAAVEIALNAGYVLGQTLGWTWGIDKKRRDVSRFVAAFSLVLLLAVAIATIGFDPLRVTLVSVALTVVIMPLVVLPFLVLMNERSMRAHTQRSAWQWPARDNRDPRSPDGDRRNSARDSRRVMMDVVRDVLDKIVVDRNGREMGRVDGILLDDQPNQPVRLVAILIGPAALGDRLHPALGRFVRRVEKRFGLDQNRPTKIDFADVDDIGARIRVRLTISDTAVDAAEKRVRAWIRRLPGAR